MAPTPAAAALTRTERSAAARYAVPEDGAHGGQAHWEITAAPVENWAALVQGCGGGFFHTPPALEVDAPPGEPLYARLSRGGEVLAIAVGTMNHCRLGAPHCYFSAPPAHTGDGHAAATALVEEMDRRGAAEVTLGSLDAGCAAPLSGAAPGRVRWEHRVRLGEDPEETARGFGKTHRRHLGRGAREGWELRALAPAEAASALREVQGSAAERAERRGDAFVGSLPQRALRRPLDSPAAPWGTAAYAAFDGGRLLAAALVGWGNRRAFYLVGGSTPEGYRRSAAVWLHWRIMALLAAHGCTVYNLGGTPDGAASPDHPAHGLRRFKEGFGGEAVECRGSRWELRPLHLRMHRLLARITTQRPTAR